MSIRSRKSSIRLALVLLAAAPVGLAAACSSSDSVGGGGSDAGDDTTAQDRAGSSSGGSSGGSGSGAASSGGTSSGGGSSGGSSSGGASSSGGSPDASDAGGSLPEGSSPSDAGEAGSTGDGGDGGDGAVACNTLTNVGPVVLVTDAGDDASVPSFRGGTLVDGTYNLTSVVVYPTDGGGTFIVTKWQETAVISGNTFTEVQSTDDGDGDLGPNVPSSYTFVASGGNLTLSPTCSTTAGLGPTPYTVTNPDGGKATFTIQFDDNVVVTFTQQ